MIQTHERVQRRRDVELDLGRDRFLARLVASGESEEGDPAHAEVTAQHWQEASQGRDGFFATRGVSIRGPLDRRPPIGPVDRERPCS